jgi:hypothetical protein
MVKILFGLLYTVIMFGVYYCFYDKVHEYIDIARLETLASTNIGLFASLTGFLIASLPFFVQVFLKQEYLIDAVDNNLNEIISALFVLMAIFIVSVLFLLFTIKNSIYLYVVFSIFLYLYILLCFYMIEIFKILKELVRDLRYLKREMGESYL